MTLTDVEFLGCIDTPNETVAKILLRRDVSEEEVNSVPTQLTLFDLNNFENNND